MTAPSIGVMQVGQEREPVVVIEHFAPDPDRLRQHAACTSFGVGDLHYPGIKGPLPTDYFVDLQPIIATVMVDIFGFRGGARVLGATYAIVTASPDHLSVEQRIPHVDAIDPGRMAIMHYLAHGDDDGTAFYRHRSTGFETLSEARSPAYFAALNTELRQQPLPPGYICGDTPLFERTAAVESVYNRALIYRSRMFHSGSISPGRDLPADPATGRLTIASFLAAR